MIIWLEEDPAHMRPEQATSRRIGVKNRIVRVSLQTPMRTEAIALNVTYVVQAMP